MSAAIALPPQQQQLLDWLTAEARARRPCPTNEAIGERFGIRGNSFAPRLLDALEEACCISIERLPRGRIVTIIKTGDVTARPAGAPPPRADLVQTIGRPALGAGEKRKPYVETANGLGAQLLSRSSASIGARPAPPVREASVPSNVASPPAAQPAALPEPETVMPETTAPAAAPLPVTMPASPALNADVSFADGALQLTVYLSTDPGPARQFKPFIIVPLTDMGALELLGTASIALRDYRLASEARAS